eukprot:CAMPEP_0174360462 /NCGR_PEP_ID=MMETSP0811_2-20130205/54305_1 /TAXON_ID=73025 ORGANISM="Eutreptiella gymnastica-like, Strain CCMP1594" /NCGR_SAMPLE_ID=MMETSP0811_2 /ASSEMBLY_ACC=CAM_ASM_000667 /LENGTH=30 /DNA_ID= /DNA_START= /DNA_END= /DNA_ORIENTATION=
MSLPSQGTAYGPMKVFSGADSADDVRWSLA